ncbi:MAG: RHS repeat-associated core domain-containing protein [Pseudomonadota bacterium]
MLASYGYDDLGRRRSLVRGNGVRTDWTPDGISRLIELKDAALGTRADQIVELTYNCVSQLTQREASNDGFAFPSYAPKTQTVTPNALNQMGSLNGATPVYDVRGNLTSYAGGNSYLYNIDNQLVSRNGSPTLAYDTAGRLATINGGADVRFDYDGQDMIAESDAAGALTRRYVHGPGVDEPLVWYEGSGTTDRRWLSADERGSITSVTDASGDALQINAYDENGVPAARNIGRFGYTGQAWLPEVGLAYYKARMYAPDLGRFLQSDPIGYGSGMNLYAYVRGDPVNYRDPGGLCTATWDNIYKGFSDGHLELVGTENFQWIGCDRAGGGDGGGFGLGEFGFGGGGGGAPPKLGTGAPQKQCPLPSGNPGNVALAGKLVGAADVVGGFKFTGTLTDTRPGGASVAFEATGVAVGMAIGSYEVKGTVPGFGSLDSTFQISFFHAEVAGIGVSGARLSRGGLGPSNAFGTISVDSGIAPLDGKITPPAGAAAMKFNNGVRRAGC